MNGLPCAQQKEQISQEFYGRPFSDLTTNEAKSVGVGRVQAP